MERTRTGSVHPAGIVWWCAAALGGAFALRTWLAWSDHSVFWPDEIHQSLEQAHRAAFGYGLIPWEFRDGARSWLFPGVVAGVWKLAAALGVDSSLTLVFLARLGMVSASVAAIGCAARLAATAHGRRAGIAAAVILATFPPAVVFSYRAMSETASAPLVVLGALLLSRRSPQASLLAGAAIASACFLRYQNGLFALVFALGLLLSRRNREALGFCSMGVLVALLGGVLDWVTWGRPFHSLLTYVDFNLILGGSADFGVEPFWFYAATLWSSVGPLLVPLLASFVVGAIAEPILGGSVVIYVVAHCLLPHKELRFLLPSLPLFATVAGVGLARLLSHVPVPRWASVAAALAVTAAFGHCLLHLDYGDMGQYTGTERAALPVWQSEQEPSLLLAAAGGREDLCGVAVIGARAAFTGGYTYLHRDVPLIYQGQLCDADSVNYVIGSTAPGASRLPAGYALAQQQGSWGLFRRDGICHPLARQDDRLLEGAGDMGLGLRRAVQDEDGSLRFDLARDSGAFVQNWGHGELLDCEVARWAEGPRSVLEFEFDPLDFAYQLRFRVRPHERASRQGMSVVFNGESVPVGTLSPQFADHALDVPERGLRPGNNRIEFVFSRAVRASDNDSRQLSALFRSIELLPKQDDFSVDVLATDSIRHLSRGFSAPEREGDVVYAWSDGSRSEVEGSLAWPRSPYELEVLAESVPYLPSQRARVSANGIFVGVLNIPAKWEVRRLSIPGGALRKGSNTIRFEYEATVRPATVDSKLTDQRPLAVRFRRVALAPIAASSDLDLGTRSARPFMLEGWSGDEQDGERSAVWNDGARASVLLSLQGIDKPILRLNAQGYVRALPIAVSVSMNGHTVGAFAAPDGWQSVAIPLPSKNYSSVGEVITLSFDHTLRPADQDAKSHDQRALALRVDRMWVEAEGALGRSTESAVRALRSGSDTSALPNGMAATR